VGERAEVIRLRVPAEPDFVSVLRVAARAVAGRAGRLDDARTRLSAAVGVAFFAITDHAPPGATVDALLSAVRGDAALTLQVPPSLPPLSAAAVAAVGVEHELSVDGRSLRLWVSD
jgi:hypothetical protein